MKLRYLASASVAALALGALAPVASAQDLGSASDSLDGQSSGLSEDAGSEVDSDSLGGSSGSEEEEEPDVEVDLTCELPGLGGSIDALEPIIEIVAGDAAVLLNLGTESLDTVPNPLEIAGGGELLESTGSLEDALCGALGGEFVEVEDSDEEDDEDEGEIDSDDEGDLAAS